MTQKIKDECQDSFRNLDKIRYEQSKVSKFEENLKKDRKLKNIKNNYDEVMKTYLDETSSMLKQQERKQKINFVNYVIKTRLKNHIERLDQYKLKLMDEIPISNSLDQDIVDQTNSKIDQINLMTKKIQAFV